MPVAVAYVRVSSKAQDHAMQRAAVERAAAARGDRIGVWYAEKQSAKTIRRPELGRLRADARAGKVGRCYVFRLDRLARSGIRDMFEVVEELRAHGVHLVTVADGFDLDGPAAEVVLAVMAWAAKMERLAINERISAARARMETEGKGWGRPCSLSPLERERVRRLRREGLSVRAIARKVRTSVATVGRTLEAASRKVAAGDRPDSHVRAS